MTLQGGAAVSGTQVQMYVPSLWFLPSLFPSVFSLFLLPDILLPPLPSCNLFEPCEISVHYEILRETDGIRTYCFPSNSTNAQYQLWDTAPYGTTGLIRLHSNNNLCLDAGSTPSNNGVVKVWTCGTGWAQQQWQQFASNGLVQTANSKLPPLTSAFRSTRTNAGVGMYGPDTERDDG